jgi:uncharacterized protein
MHTSTKNSGDFRRNNLDRSSSPYLLQHLSNPVWWQEWNETTVTFADSSGKPLLVSSGYSTCHWCHVMAAEAFSDPETAAFLNENFICIKVDREQRPDIDQYLMDFINSQGSNGGWPLNVFLNSALKPVYALTYAPRVRSGNGYSFVEIARMVLSFIRENDDKIPSFDPLPAVHETISSESLIQPLYQYFDEESGGFGTGQKFPSHSTLLFLLYRQAAEPGDLAGRMCKKTLDAIINSGLTDHLQGGIFRYCVDRAWTIPHFEKMLYDQALALWNFALAFKITGNHEYKLMALKIIKCLDESFERNGCFITAHDADTEHEEGATYLWEYEELKSLLDENEFEEFKKAYAITVEGNFEGSNHLIRSGKNNVEPLERNLLEARRKRKQPASDEKIISGLNALTAIALIHAGRFLKMDKLIKRASDLIARIITDFRSGNGLAHSFSNGILQKQSFLADEACLFVATTFLYEEDPAWKDRMEESAVIIRSYTEDGNWIESRGNDFRPVYASCFDHPVPSSVAMAEFGLLRYSILTGRDYDEIRYLPPYQFDFNNITAMIAGGLFHIFTSPGPLSWAYLPANSIQVRGSVAQDCYLGSCRLL